MMSTGGDRRASWRGSTADLAEAASRVGDILSPDWADKVILDGTGIPPTFSVLMLGRERCNDAGRLRCYFASWAARAASCSFFSSSGVSFGGSTEIVSLLSLPVNVNGT